MQQRRSSASCAAADSPCAVNTTLQWVVANATAPFCALPPIPLIDVTSLRAHRNSSQSRGKKQGCNNRYRELVRAVVSKNIVMTSLANEVLPGRMCRIRSSHSIGDIRPSQDSNAFATPADSKGKYTRTGADIVGSLRSSKEQRNAIILCEIFGPSRGMQSLDRNMGLQAVCPASFQPAAFCYDPEKAKCAFCRRGKMLMFLNAPAWRNWQTRWTQNPVIARSCGFEPLRRH
jgi:hypothetical protein